MGTGLDFHNSKCSVDLYGRRTNVVSCWHHYFKFRHIWTQYFALDAVFNVDAEDESVGIVEPVHLTVTWQGRTNELNQCDAEKCKNCVSDWRALSLARLDPSLDTNVASACMPSACGNCNLQCYLCLRNVDPVSNTCRLQSPDTKEIENMNTTRVCADDFIEGSQMIGATDWKVIAARNESITRTITCPPGSKQCTPSILFKTSHVEFSEFFFQVELNKNDHPHSWIKTVDFKMRYRNPDFSLYEIGFRYSFLILNVLVWVLFECKVCERKKYMTNEVNTSRGRTTAGSSFKKMYMPSSAVWIRLLQLALVLFNNPLYLMEYINDARRFFSIVGVIFQVTFTSILLNYWLAEFQALASDRYDAPPLVSVFACHTLLTTLYGAHY